jgi:hypothetical protein
MCPTASAPQVEPVDVLIPPPDPRLFTTVVTATQALLLMVESPLEDGPAFAVPELHLLRDAPRGAVSQRGHVVPERYEQVGHPFPGLSFESRSTPGRSAGTRRHLNVSPGCGHASEWCAIGLSRDHACPRASTPGFASCPQKPRPCSRSSRRRSGRTPQVRFPQARSVPRPFRCHS